MIPIFLFQQTQQTISSVTGVFGRFVEKVQQSLPAMITGLIVFLIFWLIAYLGKRLVFYFIAHAEADSNVVRLLSQIAYYAVLLFGFVTALSTAGLNVTALITGLGLTGFALGFALKDVLSNLLSGVMLLIYRPFTTGDYIQMGSYRGRIRSIRIRDTILEASDAQLVIIPNTKLITEVVVNNGNRPFAEAKSGSDAADEESKIKVVVEKESEEES